MFNPHCIEVAMLDQKTSVDLLKRLFHKERVLDLKALFRALETQSRMSVFRRLSLLGYLSSFTHAGKYYTLTDIPVFDSFGLWFFSGIGFARAGTLKEATVQLIETSEAGWTHQELADILRVRVYNTLLDLARAHRIRCESTEVSKSLLYVSATPERAAEQLSSRRAKSTLKHESEARLFTPELVIDVLVEAIQAGEGGLDPVLVSNRLNLRGIRVSIAHVTEVFVRFGLEKKLAGSPSKSSPR